MASHQRLAVIVVSLLVAFVRVHAQEVRAPELTARVTDFTGTLAPEEIQELESSLARFEDSTSTQIVVALLPTIGGESIEDFALRTAELNRIGRKGKDNGVLLLIAKDDRQMRIEVGYGLEGVLPDGLCGQIIRREIVPHFREGNYFAGIKAGVEAIMQATQHEYKAEPRSEEKVDFSWLVPIFISILLGILSAHNARRSRGLMRGGRLPVFYGGGWGGGTGRGRGGGFGGFSGGGGSFGGGGASGRW